MAYGARLESVLGASPRGFESPILRDVMSRVIVQAMARDFLVFGAGMCRVIVHFFGWVSRVIVHFFGW